MTHGVVIGSDNQREDSNVDQDSKPSESEREICTTFIDDKQENKWIFLNRVVVKSGAVKTLTLLDLGAQ